MKLNIQEKIVCLLLSAEDTYSWAHRLNESWPCSQIAGHRLCAQFDEKGLLDYAIDNKQTEISCDEFNAICADFLRPKLSEKHPCWFVCVGQFN